jgi:hypothetical protein
MKVAAANNPVTKARLEQERKQLLSLAEQAEKAERNLQREPPEKNDCKDRPYDLVGSPPGVSPASAWIRDECRAHSVSPSFTSIGERTRPIP